MSGIEHPAFSLILLIAAITGSMYTTNRWSRRKERPTAGTGALLLGCASVWLLFSSIQLTTSNIDMKVTWYKLQLASILPIPILLFLLAHQFTGRHEMVSARNIFLLSVAPVFVLALALTNENHRLIMASYYPEQLSTGSYLHVQVGQVLWIYAIYSYALILWSAFAISSSLLRVGRLFRWQGGTILLVVTLTTTANILDLARIRVIPGASLTPVMLMIGIPLVTLILIRLRRADIVPVARSNVIQIMQEGVIILDEQERIIDLNPKAEEVFGPLSTIFGSPVGSVWEDWDRQKETLLRTPVARKMLHIGEGEKKQVFDVYSSQLLDWRGRVISRVLILRDVTESIRIEDALRTSEEYYRALIENITDIVVIIDKDANIRYATPSLIQLTGFHKDAVIGHNAAEFMHPDDIGGIMKALSDVINKPGAAPALTARFIKADDSWMLLECIANNMLDHPYVKGLVVNGRDVTERVRSEEQLKTSLAEKEVLLKEIHHRVKNNLQIISSLLNLQSSTMRDPLAHSQFHDSQARIRSMALIHERLYRSSDLARVDFGSYLQDLGASLLSAYRSEKQDIQLLVDADSLLLDIDSAIPCGLIVNELVSNALKHAFPEGRDGRILIALHPNHDTGEYFLSVSDNGIGLPATLDFQQSETLGLQLVKSLTRQMRGKVGVETGPGKTGTAVLIHFLPMSHS